MTYPLKARVQSGRLVVEEPIDLPDGTELELVPVDDEDDLDDEDRAALHAALDRGMEDVRAGRTTPADEVLRRLRAVRGE